VLLAWQLLGFLLGYAVLVVVAIRGRGALAAIASMIVVYTVLALYLAGAWPVLYSLRHVLYWSDLRVFVYIFFSLMLAGVLRETGYLDLMVRGASGIGCRFSYAAVPSLIGLIPMPGGALVSAIAMRRKYLEESRMPPEWASFLNYWFRHIWVPVWPIFQAVIITGAVLGISPEAVVSRTWPETPAAIIAGLLVGYAALHRYKCSPGEEDRPALLLRATWPLALLAILVFVARLNLLLSLIATLAATLAALRPGREQLRRALGLATSPRIHAILFEALYLKNLLLSTSAPKAFYAAAASTGLPPWAIAIIIPYIMGLAAGGESFFAATAIPLLATYIAPGGAINKTMLLLAFTGGSMGVMSSPVHLCFALTVDYYKANPAKTLLLALTASLTTILITLLVIKPLY